MKKQDEANRHVIIIADRHFRRAPLAEQGALQELLGGDDFMGQALVIGGFFINERIIGTSFLVAGLILNCMSVVIVIVLS